MFETISNENEEVLEMRTQVVLSREDECKMLSISSNDTYDTYDPLFSTKKETYTKVIAHATEFLDQDSKVITLPSRDSDIIVLCVTLLRKDRVIINNGSGRQ